MLLEERRRQTGKAPDTKELTSYWGEQVIQKNSMRWWKGIIQVAGRSQGRTFSQGDQGGQSRCKEARFCQIWVERSCSRQRRRHMQSPSAKRSLMSSKQRSQHGLTWEARRHPRWTYRHHSKLDGKPQRIHLFYLTTIKKSTSKGHEFKLENNFHDNESLMQF